MNQVLTQALDEVLLFVLDVRLFHGNRKLNSKDLSDALAVNVPSDDIYSLGVKRVFDKEYVNKLNRVKSAMERHCSSIGPKFSGLGGYAIPEDRADGLASELDQLVVKGNAIKSDIVARFDDIERDYRARHPKWQSVIKDNAYSKSYVDNQVHFGYRCIKILAARDSGPIADGLANEIGGLLGNLMRDIAVAARRFLDESLTGRSEVTRKALRPIKAARDKLSGFVFLDPRVRPLCAMIDKVIESMPDTGAIDGPHLANLMGLVSILRDSQLALQVGERVEAESADAVFAQMFQTLQVATPATAPAATASTAIVDSLQPAAAVAQPFGFLALVGNSTAPAAPQVVVPAAALSAAPVNFADLFRSSP